MQAQSAATGSVPGKNLTQLPPDQGTSALPGEREEQSLLESSRRACVLQSAHRSTQLVSRTLCAGAHQEVFSDCLAMGFPYVFIIFLLWGMFGLPLF